MFFFYLINNFFLLVYFAAQHLNSIVERHCYWQLRNWTLSFNRKAETFIDLSNLWFSGFLLIIIIFFIGQFIISFKYCPLILYCLFLHFLINYLILIAFCIWCIYIELAISFLLNKCNNFYQLYSLFCCLF